MDLMKRVKKTLRWKKVGPILSGILCLLLVVSIAAGALSFSFSVSAAKVQEQQKMNGGDDTTDYIPLERMMRLSYSEPDIVLLLDAAPSTAEILVTVETEEGNPYVGIPFEVTFQYEEGTTPEGIDPPENFDVVTLIDEDLDGSISYEKPIPGVYHINLVHLEGYTQPDEIIITVEKPVERKVIQVETKKASAAELAQEDASYGQATKGSGGATITDTVEYVESTETVVEGSTEKKEKKDANGNTLYKAIPETVDYEGAKYLVLSDGSRSDVRVELNADGTIKAAYFYEKVGVGGPEEGEAEGTTEEPATTTETPTTEEPTTEEPAPENPEPTNPEPENPTPETPEPTNPEPENPTPETPEPTNPEPVEKYEWVEKTSSIIGADGRPVEEGKYRFRSVEPIMEESAEQTIKYTGWQTIDGRTCYFDKDGNKVTGTQIIQGKQVVFGEDGALRTSTTKGIDVSQWNCRTTIDWAAVKASGVDFVIVRCGLRGSTAGGIYEDDMFFSNIRGAKAAGLKVGIYFFTLAATEQQAVEEASACVQMARRAGVNLDYPIFMDLEDPVSSGAQANAYKALSTAQRTEIVNAFCETVRGAGYRAGLYANKYWLNAKVRTGSLSSGTVIWLAHYTSKSDYGGRYEMWQYSGSGGVPGIYGAVDMNVSYLGY